VRIVIDAGHDRPLPWSADTLFALGGKDSGPEMFYRVNRSSVGTDSHDNIYVWDPSNSHLVVFDGNGEFLWSAGREGGGPGEVKSGNSLAVDREGTAYIYDWGKSALVRYGERGAVLSEVHFPYTPIRAWDGHFAPNRSGFTFWRRERFQGSDERTTELLRVENGDTTVLFATNHSLTRTARLPGCPLTLTLPVLFAPSLLWHSVQDEVVVNVTADYILDVFRAGAKTLSVRRAIEPVEVTEAAALGEFRDRARLGPVAGCSASPREILKEIGYEPRRQVVSALMLSPDGVIWVQRRLENRDEFRIDIFAVDGVYLGTLPPQFPFPVVIFEDGRIGVRLKDELDVERLAVIRIRRGTAGGDGPRGEG
jgi:hypothetical protein